MRPASGNAISQGMHGQYKAVDYRATPDVWIYAPETMTITRYDWNGDAGMQIQAEGPNGRHGFAHTDSTVRLVKVGDKVVKGQRIAKMGYTGLTIPAGPAGIHLHWTLYTPGGYVYPLSKVTEPFGGGATMSTVGDIELDMLSKAFFGYPANDEFIKAHKGTESNTMIRWCDSNPAHAAWLKQIKAWQEDTSEFVKVTDLYIKK